MKRLSFVLPLVLAACGGTSATAPDSAEPVVEEEAAPTPDWPAEESEPLVVAEPEGPDMPPWAPGMYPPAVVHWEIMSHDAAALAAWYSDLFGWDHTDWQEEGGGFEYYLMFSRGQGYGIGGGIGQIPPADESGQQMPPYLTFYVDVVDVDASAGRLVELGGTIVHGPFDVPGVGRMVMFADPGGHVFAMMTGENSEEHADDMPMSFASAPVGHWEIATRSPEPVRAFYAALFGWTYDQHAEPDYAEVGCEHPYGIAGGIGAIAAESEMPEHVSFYVGVDDLQVYLDRAVELGGEVVSPPRHVMEGVDIAAVRDIDGNRIGLFLVADSRMTPEADEAPTDAE